MPKSITYVIRIAITDPKMLQELKTTLGNLKHASIAMLGDTVLQENFVNGVTPTIGIDPSINGPDESPRSWSFADDVLSLTYEKII